MASGTLQKDNKNNIGILMTDTSNIVEYHGIKLDLSRDDKFSVPGKELMSKYYSNGKDGVQKAIAQAAITFSYGDLQLAQDIYDAASQHWFFYSSPVLSNAPVGTWDPTVDYKSKEFWAPENGDARRKAWIGKKPKAMPIACFLTFLPDTIEGQISASVEISRLSVAGGGTSLHNNIRAVSDKAPGPIPYFKTVDGIMGYYRQGKTRRGSCGIYMDISHPDVVEFVNMRKTSGGDPARKINNRAGVHNAVNLTDAFADAVDADADWNLVCPHTGEIKETLKARVLWEQLLEVRELTGEPYLYFIDVANRMLPESQKKLGLVNRGSNLCSEITLATDENRSAVCALSSVNLEYYEDWKNTNLVANLVRFIDNVIQWYIDWASDEVIRTKYSAMRERAIGIGAMGWHNFLMSKDIAFESGGFNSAVQWNHRIFADMQAKGIAESLRLGTERGEAPDMAGTGRRNSHLFALAPNSNSSILCNTSSAMEPIASNAYPQKTRAGIFLMKNRYLERKLEALGQNTEEVWKSITKNNGSVQHLEFLSDELKIVYRTAWEIDQHWIVQHAGDRQQYICQAQSCNLFFMPGTDRAYINSVHLKAMRERKVKSLYYFRTGAATKADTVSAVVRKSLADWKETPTEDGGVACVSCEG
jgi:ribonucleoside-diphosphate reductase alpha chain